MVKILKINMVEIVENSELEPEVDDKLEPRPKVIAELVLLQEEISSWPTKVVELPIETLVDLQAEPTMKLVSPLAAMRVSIFLRSPDVYDPL